MGRSGKYDVEMVDKKQRGNGIHPKHLRPLQVPPAAPSDTDTCTGKRRPAPPTKAYTDHAWFLNHYFAKTYDEIATGIASEKYELFPWHDDWMALIAEIL